MEGKKGTAIVLAAGQGKRMGTKKPKQYLEIQGKPVLWYSLDVFQRSELIQEIILVTGAGEIEFCRELARSAHIDKLRAVVAGGVERYHSVWNGLQAMESERERIVFIHDGVRPFITEEILRRAYDEACRSGACEVGMPVKDTIRILDENGRVSTTPKRSLVWQIQTPQVFASELIVPAYRELIAQEQELLSQGVQITDDVMVVEQMCGRSACMVQGSYENIKITTPEDLKIAEVLALDTIPLFC
ncbi:MAG: 2-C-methyl-D-erythritol 4-phosphate cytidylyltransferase [Lachnospiraceae bacterium]|nr:2-C-methyl-D-erythritol 4-phosphate cytidylyltransferase [Lachnospiraceae bacterium]